MQAGIHHWGGTHGERGSWSSCSPSCACLYILYCSSFVLVRLLWGIWKGGRTSIAFTLQYWHWLRFVLHFQPMHRAHALKSDRIREYAASESWLTPIYDILSLVWDIVCCHGSGYVSFPAIISLPDSQVALRICSFSINRISSQSRYIRFLCLLLSHNLLAGSHAIRTHGRGCDKSNGFW